MLRDRYTHKHICMYKLIVHACRLAGQYIYYVHIFLHNNMDSLIPLHIYLGPADGAELHEKIKSIIRSY